MPDALKGYAEGVLIIKIIFSGKASERSLLQHFSVMTANGKRVLLITDDKKSLSHCNKTISLDEQ